MITYFFAKIWVTKLQDNIGELRTYLVGEHFDGVIGIDIWSDGDLALKWFHKDRIFIEAVHVHLFYGIKGVIFEVSDFEYLTVATFAKEDPLVPVVVITEGKIVLLHKISIIYCNNYIKSTCIFPMGKKTRNFLFYYFNYFLIIYNFDGPKCINCKFDYMNLDIFESTRHWNYTKEDELA